MTTDQVGVISIFPEYLRGDMTQVLRYLEEVSRKGRLVSWGVWREMNELFRGCPMEFYDAVSGGEYGSVGLRDGGTALIKQVQGTRWTIAITDQGDVSRSRSFVLWDLWEWAKRSPKSGETPRQLYSAARRVSDTLGVNPRHWFSPSAIASPLMRRAGVMDHLPDEEELGIPEIARWAMFSGRMQILRLGHSDQPAREYDLNSAYAWGLSQLPSLRGAYLLRRSYPSPGLMPSKWSLCRVKWDIQINSKKTPIYPLPVRVSGEKGSPIIYPRKGEGWYWSPMVDAAMHHFGGDIEILEELQLVYPETHRPFGFIEDLYKHSGNFSRGSLDHNIFKWTLSCIWGKLLQKEIVGRGKSFRSLLWAGMATSLVNSELLRVAMIDPQRVWHIHVDSILMSGSRDHIDNIGSEMGQWRAKDVYGVQQYRVGLWRGWKDGGWSEKSQGIPSGVFNWVQAEEEWRTFSQYGRVPVSWPEFVGFGAGTYEDWLSHRQVEYAVPLRPGKMMDINQWRDQKSKFITWHPEEEADTPLPFNTAPEDYGDEFGVDHNTSRSQERRG